MTGYSALLQDSVESSFQQSLKLQALLVIRYTRNWIHYGVLAHILICVTVGAVERLFGR